MDAAAANPTQRAVARRERSAHEPDHARHPAGRPWCLAKPEMKKTREGFGHALVDLGETDPSVVVLVGDLSSRRYVSFFAEKFPERFFQVGIAEQNMMCVAAGLAAMGKIPFFATYGAFASCRSADQIRVTVAYTNLPVKIGGAHGGIASAPTARRTRRWRRSRSSARSRT